MDSQTNCSQCNNTKNNINQIFDSTFEVQKEINKQNEQNRLNILSQEATQELIKKPILQYTIDDYSIGFSTNMLGVMDDLINKEFNISIFTKDNRIFYVGITILIIALSTLILNILF
jgi:hypothetical protein